MAQCSSLQRSNKLSDSTMESADLSPVPASTPVVKQLLVSLGASLRSEMSALQCDKERLDWSTPILEGTPSLMEASSLSASASLISGRSLLNASTYALVPHRTLFTIGCWTRMVGICTLWSTEYPWEHPAIIDISQFGSIMWTVWMHGVCC